MRGCVHVWAACLPHAAASYRGSSGQQPGHHRPLATSWATPRSYISQAIAGKPQLTRKVDMDNPRKPKQSGKLLLTGPLTETFYCASGSSGEVPSGGGHVTSSAAQRGEQLLTPGRVGADRPECARVPASYIHTTRIWSHETRTAHARPAQHGHQPSSDTGTLDTIIEKWDWR